MKKEAFDALAVIAMRKSLFYQESRDLLVKQLPPYVDESAVRAELRHAISELDNSLFIGKQEKAAKIVDPSKSLGELELDRNKIVEAVLAELSRRRQ